MNISNCTSHTNNIKQLQSCIKYQYFEIRLLILQVKSIEQNINKFIAEYNKSLGTLKNNALNYSLNYSENKILKSKLKEYNNILEHKLKSTYRKLALICHPDTSTKTSRETFLAIANAYQNKDLNKLLNLEITITEIGNQPSLEVLKELETEYNIVKQYASYLKQQKNLLLTSPAYLLQKKISLAKKYGIDLIEKIKNSLKIYA